jgi:uncharacterized protein (TIGR02284 family)
MAEDKVDVQGTGETPASSGAGASLRDPGTGEAAQVRPGDPGQAAYPLAQAEYWREAFAGEPYYESGRSFADYATAYELGWGGYHVYGGEFDPAERVLANDWMMRKGVSTLPWEQARPAVRAAWQRADNARSFVTDGTAGPADVRQTLGELFGSACDGEQGFREAVAHARSPELVALFERLAQQCAGVAAELQSHIERLGGTADQGGTMAAAAQRAWLQIRSLFGGASDEKVLAQCERGQADMLGRYREALRRHLPDELHALVQQQFEQAQRHHDHLRRMQDRKDIGAAGGVKPAEREAEPVQLQ